VADQGPRTITKRNVLVVEGEDERRFFDGLFRHIAITEVQIEVVGGKNQFKDQLPALLNMPGFYMPDGAPLVGCVAIVRDRDKDDAFVSIANIVRKAGLTPPLSPGRFSDEEPRVGIFIMPGDTIEGTMLEDLCLKTVENSGAMDCVEKFAACISALPDPPKNMSKAKVQVFKAHVFLATQSQTVDSMGLGAQKGYWDLDSPCLGELKGFLNQMR